MQRLFLLLILVAPWGFAETSTESQYTGVFRGDKTTGVITSWSLDSGSMSGTWLTNGNVEIAVVGRYQREKDRVSFLLEGKVIKVRIVGMGQLNSLGGEGTFTLFSEDPGLTNGSGTWSVVSGYANLTLQKRTPPPAPVGRPSEENLAKKAVVQEIRNAFLPGVSGSLLVPFKEGSTYAGVNIHYAFIQGISTSASSSNFGGYYEWYSEIGYYKEMDSNAYDNIFFTYSTGVNLSFEKFLHSYRSVFVPYFGAKVGGLFFNEGSGGLYLEPVLGLVVVQTRAFNVNYDAGLFLNSANLSDNIGLRHSLVINVNL